MRKRNLNLAALVEAAARAVDVRKSYGDAVDIVVCTVKRKLNSPFGVLAQAISQIDSTGFDIDSHETVLR